MNPTTPDTAPTLPWPYPTWIAHRGAGRQAPENTLAALRLGAQLGWKAFECDVKLSADGIPYLLHDDTLERTTSGHGAAREATWSQLSQLDAGAWLNPLYAGEPPATLAAAARFCLHHGSLANLEIKPCPGTETDTGRTVATAVQALWGEAVHQGHAHWPLLSSFEPEALAAARQAAPEIPRALLLEALPTPGQDDSAVTQALALGCCAAVFHHPLLSPALIARCHQAGLRVLSYTVNDVNTAHTLLNWGLDGIISDEVHRLGEFAAHDPTTLEAVFAALPLCGL